MDFSRERWKQRLIDTHDGSFDLCHFLSAVLSSDRCSRRTSGSQEFEGEACAGLEERGHVWSKQEVKVEHNVSV